MPCSQSRIPEEGCPTGLSLQHLPHTARTALPIPQPGAGTGRRAAAIGEIGQQFRPGTHHLPCVGHSRVGRNRRSIIGFTRRAPRAHGTSDSGSRPGSSWTVPPCRYLWGHSHEDSAHRTRFKNTATRLARDRVCHIGACGWRRLFLGWGRAERGEWPCAAGPHRRGGGARGARARFEP